MDLLLGRRLALGPGCMFICAQTAPGLLLLLTYFLAVQPEPKLRRLPRLDLLHQYAP
jgi:hypothetical protein